MKDTLILAIESSCDETAAAVVKNGRTILSNIINSQIAIHTEYGGVVPEIASRKHIENINPVIRMALDEAGVTLDDIDAIGVTYGPGLVGALLVGVAEETNIENWRNVIKEKDLNWFQIHNGIKKEDFVAKYNITGFPTKILISPDGIILYRAMNETDEFYENVTKFIK